MEVTTAGPEAKTCQNIRLLFQHVTKEEPFVITDGFAHPDLQFAMTTLLVSCPSALREELMARLKVTMDAFLLEHGWATDGLPVITP
jgi:hypothetical protein